MQIKYSNIGDEPVTIAEAKSYLKVDFPDEDTLLTSLITGVREKIEEFTGLALVVKTIEYFNDVIYDEIELPYPEHDAVVEFKLNNEVSTAYSKTGLTQFIIKPNSTTINVNGSTDNQGVYVKYTTTGSCPQGIKDEILRLIAEKYRKRGNTFNGATAELSENSFANLMQYVQI